jgi:hypothetical protein
VEELVTLAKRGLHNLTWEGRRAFLDALNVRCTVSGDLVEVEGLITPAVLDLARNTSDKPDNHSVVYSQSISAERNVKVADLYIPFAASISLAA